MNKETEGGGNLTRSCQHLLPGEHCVRSGHETHGLLRFSQRIPSSSQSDDCCGQYDTGSSNRAEHSMEGNGLIDRENQFQFLISRGCVEEGDYSRRFLPVV